MALGHDDNEALYPSMDVIGRPSGAWKCISYGATARFRISKSMSWRSAPHLFMFWTWTQPFEMEHSKPLASHTMRFREPGWQSYVDAAVAMVRVTREKIVAVPWD